MLQKSAVKAQRATESLVRALNIPDWNHTTAHHHRSMHEWKEKLMKEWMDGWMDG